MFRYSLLVKRSVSLFVVANSPRPFRAPPVVRCSLPVFALLFTCSTHTCSNRAAARFALLFTCSTHTCSNRAAARFALLLNSLLISSLRRQPPPRVPGNIATPKNITAGLRCWLVAWRLACSGTNRGARRQIEIANSACGLDAVYNVAMTTVPDSQVSVLNAISMPSLKALDGLQRLYGELDRDIAGRQPVCNTSGRCCKFELWGHRLFVSTLELAWFRNITLQQTATSMPLPSKPPTMVTFPLPLYAENGQFNPGCPWQVDGLCTAREARPLGCRIYFCDTTTESWQHERYEYYHQAIAALHETFRLPYRYMEWREALALIAAQSG